MKNKYYGDEVWEEPNELQEIQDALKGFDEYEDDLKKSEQKEEKHFYLGGNFRLRSEV